MKPLAIVPWFPGTNCHPELAAAFELAGANAVVSPLQSGPRLWEADLIGWAGGFSYGDHLRSGAIAACDLLARFRDELELALQKQIPMIGICNGFQILVETGLLPGDGPVGSPTAVLDLNKSERSFTHLSSEVTICFRQPPEGNCLWLTEVDGQAITMPVAHGEGRLTPEKYPGYNVVATYGTPEGDVSASPNGSPIAGICSPNRTIFGLMPHPERRVDILRGGDQALGIFRAAVNAVR